MAEADSDISQYKQDYQPWQLQRTPRAERKAEWQPPTGKMDGSTEMCRSFPAHPVQRRQQREKQQWAPPSEAFVGESLNKADFQPKFTPREAPYKPKDELQLPTEPFTAVSGNREEYPTWEVQPRQRKAAATYEKPTGAMDLSSSYAAEFVRPTQSVRLPPIRPADRKEESPPFAGSTETREQYQQLRPQAKRSSFRPQRSYQPPTQPFAAASSYAGDFVAAAPGAERPRAVRHPGELRLSDGRMDTVSTSSAAFVQLAAAERRQQYRPAEQLQLPTEPFVAETTQRGDYSPRQQPRRQPIRHSNQLQLPTERFDGTTVMRQDFVHRAAGRQLPVRHAGELQLPTEPMDTTTTTREVFTPKQRDGPPPRRRPLHQETVQPAAA